MFPLQVMEWRTGAKQLPGQTGEYLREGGSNTWLSRQCTYLERKNILERKVRTIISTERETSGKEKRDIRRKERDLKWQGQEERKEKKTPVEEKGKETSGTVQRGSRREKTEKTYIYMYICIYIYIYIYINIYIYIFIIKIEKEKDYKKSRKILNKIKKVVRKGNTAWGKKDMDTVWSTQKGSFKPIIAFWVRKWKQRWSNKGQHEASVNSYNTTKLEHATKDTKKKYSEN